MYRIHIHVIDMVSTLIPWLVSFTDTEFYRFDEGHGLAEFTPADAFLVYPLMVISPIRLVLLEHQD